MVTAARAGTTGGGGKVALAAKEPSRDDQGVYACVGA